jgi:hypothetical protein
MPVLDPSFSADLREHGLTIKAHAEEKADLARAYAGSEGPQARQYAKEAAQLEAYVKYALAEPLNRFAFVVNDLQYCHTYDALRNRALCLGRHITLNEDLRPMTEDGSNDFEEPVIPDVAEGDLSRMMTTPGQTAELARIRKAGPYPGPGRNWAR